MHCRSLLPRILAAGLAAGGLVTGLMATQAAAVAPGAARAAAASSSTTGRHAPSSGVSPTVAAVQAARQHGKATPTGPETGRSQATVTRAKPVPAKLRGEPVALGSAKPSKPRLPGHAARNAAGAARPAAVTSCTTSDFSGRSGSDLVSYIKTVDWVACINPLFSLTGSDAKAVFNQNQMLAVANGVADAASSYTGDDSGGLFELMYFMQAGYYVQYGDPADVGTYDSSLRSAIESGFNALFADSHANDVSAGNGSVLAEAFVLTDSAQAQADYLDVYARYLSAYDSSTWDAVPEMDQALNAIYTPLWRGPWITDFVTAITANPGIADTLSTFTLAHRDLLGGDNDVLDSNAGNDLANFLQIPALQSKVRPLVKGLLDGSSITGATDNLWVHVAYQANLDDSGQCSYYGVCDLTQQLTAAALPIDNSCSNFTIMAQALTATEQSDVCTSLSNEVAFYQNQVKTTTPIPGEYFDVKMVIFGSRADYTTYSWAIFGNDTDNGGETLTGTPTDPNNVAYSILYQEPTDNGFTANAWNLNHEFAHIQQSIYDMKGDFGTQTTVPDVWWIEGQAEYVSYTYRNLTDDGALTEAAKHTYKLSQLFQNTYAIDDETRTYPWGYLAVRYMTEKHPDQIQDMLAKMRTGDYQGAYAVYNTIGTSYDADFDAWLTTLAGGGNSGGGTATACTDTNTQAMDRNCYRSDQSRVAGDTDYFWVYLPAGTTTLKVTTSGGTGNADLYYDPANWAGPSTFTEKSTNPDNTESITVTNTDAGYRYLSLYAVTDFSGVTVTTSY
ncbi:M9 family metallopeptidase [Streptomyces sp. NBC_00669]|uniref:M9 family metallopeptidase n=1 Tax=Streptomyces sp. NBC_00669 TaxID=2976011 RepID=UPI002E32B87F|nr:M9 family metallopeptidase [Streptomyces sp. NBC_00669]